MIADARVCELGEGPLWHPERGELFWFDIMGRRLLAKGREWAFPGYVSAAGWVDRDHLLIAAQDGLHLFDIATGGSEPVAAIEADNPLTRSNDGRADPQGGFWIGTMQIAPPRQAIGAIYRYYRGEVRRMFDRLTIPNAICFAPDGRRAYFTDTAKAQIMTVPLDDDGWPKGDPVVLIDLAPDGLHPDGAITDAAGNIWNAQWGAGRVAGYTPDGRFLRAIAFGAAQTSCPALGGPDLTTLFCTTAAEGLDPPAPDAGKLFAAETDIVGRPEPRVIL
ncbi:MAG: SMP-30/gluconolactonase/LRE family protein [Limimaricola sp.]|uniref:SMP-30/gluconolactonase/LRE family protein n=1 Tax=Limimaricola sp. TaxID=2211665 RepID=UPI001D79881F|nr:SMP-30/gluconolactonase/LRE family protein [Limimaricola sp.]MBI1417536.1 SMP-30/gluconolactonase/LRE family protein [Limimaricola sp.]